LINVTNNNDQQLEQYGTRRHVWMKNIAFNGKLPKFLGFDKEICLQGDADCLSVGALFRSPTGVEKFLISNFRFITDLGTDECESALFGGVSGRRFSSLYTQGVDNFLQCQFKQFSNFVGFEDQRLLEIVVVVCLMVKTMKFLIFEGFWEEGMVESPS